MKEFGDRVLIVYGGGSIKRSGLYDTVVKLLDDHGIYHTELSGVEPNPRVTTANRGVKICREENIDVILLPAENMYSLYLNGKHFGEDLFKLLSFGNREFYGEIIAM